MLSGTDYDACKIARIAPTAMIFVPCKDGVSHTEREDAEPDDLAAGTQVFAQVMLDAAEAVLGQGAAGRRTRKLVC